MDESSLRSGRANTDGWLWTDDGPFESCHRQTATTLVAIAKVIGREPAPSGDQREFLTLFDKVAGGDADAFTQAWISPGARSWVNRALDLFEALGRARRSNEGVEPAAAALDQHLNHFKRFALGQHLLSGADLVFDSPYTCQLPILIPGTGWQIEGPAGIDILGTEGGGVRVSVDGRLLLLSSQTPVSSQASGVKLTTVSSVETENGPIFLTPVALQLPWLVFDHVSRAAAFGSEGHRRSCAFVEQALGHMKRHAPDSFEQFIRQVQVIALGDPLRGISENATSNETPGAFFAVARPNPFKLADTFIHEFHHLRLFSLESQSPLIITAGASDQGPSLHYSPWRMDLRPLRGLLHAAYVFQPVCGYWLDVLRSPSMDADVRGYAADQARRILLRLEIALHTLRQSSELTSAGQATVESLVRGAERLGQEADDLGLDPNPPAYVYRPDGRFDPIIDPATGEPATAGDAIKEHARRYDLTGEAAPILAAASA